MLSSLFSRLAGHRRTLLASVLGLLTLGAPVAGWMAESTAPATSSEVQFMRDVAPILARRCFSCHGPKEPERDLRLDIYEGMTKGDHPAVVAGEPASSGMYQHITEEDSSSRMPRDEEPLTPAQIDLIRRWILAGAKFDGPDPKTPYATKPDAPGAAPGAPHPIRPPAAAAERVPAERPQAEAPERKSEKS